MPIRFVDRRAHVGRVQAAVGATTGLLQGTHTRPPARTGVVGSQLQPAVGALVGGFTQSANRTGTIAVPLASATGILTGTFQASGAPVTATKYVSMTGSDSPSNGSQASPFRTIQYGLTQIQAGESLGILLPHTETLNWSSLSGGGAGSANHKVVKAITPGTVITGTASGTNANCNLTFMDFQWKTGTSEFDTQNAQRLVFIRTGVSGGGGTSSGNVVQWIVGSNQAYHGCYADGTGGRYTYLAFQVSNVLFNECVVRTQANVWGPPQSNPTAGITVYSCPSNIDLINCVAVDCQNQGNGAEWLGGFNFVSNVGAQAGVTVRQCISTDNSGLIGIQVDGSSADSVQFIDTCSVRNQYGAVLGTHLGGSSVVTFTRGEFSANSEDGIADFGNANSSANQVNTSGNGGENFRGISGSGNTTNALNMATRIANYKRYGTTFGLLRGESGWDVPTSQNVWDAFPNQDMIRSKLAAVSTRGFCGGSFTLTSYVRR